MLPNSMIMTITCNITYSLLPKSKIKKKTQK